MNFNTNGSLKSSADPYLHRMKILDKKDNKKMVYID